MYWDGYAGWMFRSMVQGADERKVELEHLNDGAAGLFKIIDDPRVTRIGRFIRAWQIDELPQPCRYRHRLESGQLPLSRLRHRSRRLSEARKIFGRHSGARSLPQGARRRSAECRAVGARSQIPVVSAKSAEARALRPSFSRFLASFGHCDSAHTPLARTRVASPH